MSRDFASLKSRLDLRAVIESRIGPGIERGGRVAWVCPFHADKNPSFYLNPDGISYRCFGCGARGDAFTFIQQIEHIDITAAYDLLAKFAGQPTTGGGPSRPKHKAKRKPAPLPKPPNETWQARGLAFAIQCHNALFEDIGKRALAWLRDKRGLAVDTIERAGFGYNPGDLYEKPEAWGQQGDKDIFLPRGITLPRFYGPDLWHVNIRPPRPIGTAKYIGPRGYQQCLYNLDNVSSDKPVVMVEGEIDAETIQQVAGDLVTAVSIGPTAHARAPFWAVQLWRCPLVLLAFDDDPAGHEARSWWGARLSNSRDAIPTAHDVNDMHTGGQDVRGWIAQFLAR